MSWKCFFGHEWIYENIGIFKSRNSDIEQIRPYIRVCKKCGIKERATSYSPFGDANWFRVE